MKHEKDRKCNTWNIYWLKRTGRANKWKQELEEGYNEKGDLCFQNNNKKKHMHAILS